MLPTTVNRVSRSGVIICPNLRLALYQGLKSITDWAAFAALEEKLKGTFPAGKLADFVILHKHPLNIAPMQITNLQVIKTKGEEEAIYGK